MSALIYGGTGERKSDRRFMHYGETILCPKCGQPMSGRYPRNSCPRCFIRDYVQACDNLDALTDSEYAKYRIRGEHLALKHPEGYDKCRPRSYGFKTDDPSHLTVKTSTGIPCYMPEPYLMNMSVHSRYEQEPPSKIPEPPPKRSLGF